MGMILKVNLKNVASRGTHRCNSIADRSDISGTIIPTAVFIAEDLR